MAWHSSLITPFENGAAMEIPQGNENKTHALGAENKTILIVEDNLDFHMLTKLALKKCGYKVESLFDGKLKEVLNKLMTCDIVLLDVDLPSESGSSISNCIKSNPKTTHIPIIMITGNAEGPEICSEAHADACLIKPFPFASLLTTIESVFSAGGNQSPNLRLQR